MVAGGAQPGRAAASSEKHPPAKRAAANSRNPPITFNLYIHQRAKGQLRGRKSKVFVTAWDYFRSRFSSRLSELG